MDRVTIRYSVGTGVSTELMSTMNDDSVLKRLWSSASVFQKRGDRFGAKVWRIIRDVDRRYGTRKDVSDQIRGWWVVSWTESGRPWQCMRAFVCCCLRHWIGGKYGVDDNEIVHLIRRRLVEFFAGRYSYCLIHYFAYLRRMRHRA